MTDLTPGLIAEQQRLVTEELTAEHLGSGNVKVLATPAMIMLMEMTAVNSVDPLLPDGQQTVGIRVDVRHLAATPVDVFVRFRTELIEVDGYQVREISRENGVNIVSTR